MRLTALTLAAAMAAAPIAAVPALAESAWDAVAFYQWPDREMEASGLVRLEAPERAQDAALVPITMSLALPEGDPRRVERLTLVIDENPSPLAAEFTLGEAAGVSEISTRVRVDSYSHVHAVAELSDGSLHVAERFVKASGGCSAPMLKDPEAALAGLGEMRLRRFDGEVGAALVGDAELAEAQLMIRHPNNSGLQRDPLTLYPIPAHFVEAFEVTQGDDLILSMRGGISISEDPSFRFDYRPTGEAIHVRAADTEGATFEGDWPASGS